MTRFGFSAFARAAAATLALLSALSCGEERATDPLAPVDDSPTKPRAGNLVECPSNLTASAQTIVPPLGGLVSLDGNSIAIPSGALTLPTLITLTIPASRFVEVDVKANSLASFLFNAPVSITIDYSRCDRATVDQAPLTVWHIDPVTKQLLENMGGADNKAARSITFQTDHLSTYAIAF